MKSLLIAVLIAAPMIWAQQRPVFPVATQGLDEYQRQQWNKGSGTRTDMAPKYEAPNGFRAANNSLSPSSQPETRLVIRAYTTDDARRDCEKANQREAEATLRVQQLQNAKGQIPIAQPILNSIYLQTEREQAKKDCEHAGEQTETRTIWGPSR